MADFIRELAAPLLMRYGEDHDLCWRDHRLRATVGPAVGGQPTQARFVFPSRCPFILLDLVPSSIRAYDGQIVETQLRSRERTFVDEWVPLDCLGLRAAAGGPRSEIPAAIFFGNEELIWLLQRLWPVNPFELYPGPANDSIITLDMRGVEVMPKGSVHKPIDVK